VGALSKLGGSGVVTALSRGLRDPDVEVRVLAVDGLTAVGDEPACRALTAALSDKDDQVRAKAAKGLAGQQGADSEAALVAMLSGSGRGARRAAAEALTARGWKPSDDAQRALLLVALENPLGAEALGEAALEALGLAVVDDGHYYLSQTAAECLGRLFDPRAVGALCRALKESTDMTVRAAVATALGQIRDPQAIMAVVEALETETDKWPRPYLVAALAKLQAAAQGDRLVLGLEDEDPIVRLRAALLLARRGDTRGPAWLAAAIRGDDVPLRGKAIQALRALGGPEAIRILIERISAGGYDGPNEAVDALVELGEPSTRPLAEALVGMDHNARRTSLRGLARMGLPGMAALQAVLSEADRELKKITCDVLGCMGDRVEEKQHLSETLAALSDDLDPEVRRAAAHALGLLKAG
jgi:HEAT repeat protein